MDLDLMKVIAMGAFVAGIVIVFASLVIDSKH